MKTTIDISDNILGRARELAGKLNVTLRALVEEGLQMVLETKEKTCEYKVKPVVFSGKGLSPSFRDANWQEIRDAAYRGRGA